jgi:hypothetical protein
MAENQFRASWLIAVGLIFLLLSGTCDLVTIPMFFGFGGPQPQPQSSGLPPPPLSDVISGDLGTLTLATILSWPFILIGIVLLALGIRRRWRSRVVPPNGHDDD